MVTFNIQNQTGIRTSFAELSIGPVSVTDPNGTPVIVSERMIYQYNGEPVSYSELIGFPSSQLTNQYWFPWYDNLSMQSWILVGNPSTSATAHVDIYIAGVKQNTIPYDIPPGGRITPQYPILNGPVHIVSDINVFASERVHTGQGFVNEAMGIPNNQLTTQYWFPWYDNLSMQSWILVGKP